MLLGILALFAAAALAPPLAPRLGRLAGAGFALLPAGLFVSLLGQTPEVAAGATAREVQRWAPSLGLSLSFVLDGLSLLFALLIVGIGALVLVYAGAYLEGDPRLGRLLGTLLLFMGAMLGVVLSDNLLALFVFWELTSIASYLLVGFDHDEPAARAAALQALLVTGGGGLALLAGILLIGQVGGSYEISLLATGVHPLRGHALYLPALLLVLAGAFTKSAQWPFHFWLPGAMAAPTPVSAYLHSATMVKAGVYLLLRLNPLLGGSDAWHYVITLAGAITMLTGALLALPQTDLKRILAYTTVSTLGALVLLIGLDTSLAVKAALVLLLVHALYKGALFLAAGILDHETGTRDVERLGGLARVLPITATATVLAALSMAGLPPLFGFVGKELLYEAKTQAPSAAWLVTSAGLVANVFVFAASGLVALRPFFGRRPPQLDATHEAGPGLWLGPAVLAAASLVFGVLPNASFGPLLEAAVGAVRAETTRIELALWHGLNPILLLSLATIAAGVTLYLLRRRVLALAAPLRPLLSLGPEHAYARGLDALVATAKVTAALLQGGSLRHHVGVVVAVTVGLAGGALLSRGGAVTRPDLAGLPAHEALLAALIVAGALATALFGSRLAAVAALGLTGLAVALTFLLFGGPDLAMTQLAVETLSVILFVFVVYRLPRFLQRTSPLTRLRDLALAASAGALMSVLVWTASAGATGSVLSEYFARASVPEGRGRNVVNVILVDFRALDTLGEVTVLATAALGVFALLRLRPRGARP